MLDTVFLPSTLAGFSNCDCNLINEIAVLSLYTCGPLFLVILCHGVQSATILKPFNLAFVESV